MCRSRGCPSSTLSTRDQGVHRPAMRDQVGPGFEAALQRRVDLEEQDIGEEAVDPRIRAAALRAEQEPGLRHQMRQDLEVGDATGEGFLRRQAADALAAV